VTRAAPACRDGDAPRSPSGPDSCVRDKRTNHKNPANSHVLIQVSGSHVCRHTQASFRHQTKSRPQVDQYSENRPSGCQSLALTANVSHHPYSE
jgi:hypothetical protein